MNGEMDKNTTNQSTDGDTKKGCLYVVLVIIAFAVMVISGSSGSSSSSKECPICSREFSDSSNRKSIRKTNMCTRCYNNYKTANEMLGY